MKILIIDNNIDPECWGAEDLCHLARTAKNSTLYIRRAPQNDLPSRPQDFDRIIVSGSRTSILDDSPWVGRLIEFTQAALEYRVPYLGVCYGHQILARAMGGKEYVGKAQNAEFGWTSITLSPSPSPSSLFSGIPAQFYSFSAHFEEVKKLPQGVTALAYSKDCKIQAIQVDGQPAFGIQFHPEKTAEDGKKILLERQKERNPIQLLNPDLSHRLYDSTLGQTLFSNFLNMRL